MNPHQRYLSAFFFSLVATLISSKSFAEGNEKIEKADAKKWSGPYADRVKALPLKDLKAFYPTKENGMSCLHTPNNPLLIGLAHQVIVKAPLNRTIEVFEDFDHYAEIFTSIKKSKKITPEKPDPNHLQIELEGIVPFPFVPNITYQVEYEIAAETKDEMKAYRFHLLKSEDLKSLDGYVVIRKRSETETLYNEIDFLDAKWGIAKTFAPKTIWSDSVEDILQTDFAFKLRAEEPKLPSKEVVKRVKKFMESREEQKEIEECIQSKKSPKEFL